MELWLPCKQKQLRPRPGRHHINVLAKLLKHNPRGIVGAAGERDNKRASKVCAGLQSGEVVLLQPTSRRQQNSPMDARWVEALAAMPRAGSLLKYFASLILPHQQTAARVLGRARINRFPASSPGRGKISTIASLIRDGSPRLLARSTTHRPRAHVKWATIFSASPLTLSRSASGPITRALLPQLSTHRVISSSP